MVPAGEGLVQLQVADDIPQGGGGQVFNGAHGMLHAVGVELGVDDLEVDDRVNLHGHVVLGNDRLGREVHHLFLQAHLFGHPVQDRQLDMQAHAPCGIVRPQSFHHVRPRLLDHMDVCHQQDQQNDADCNQNIWHNFLLLFCWDRLRGGPAKATSLVYHTILRFSTISLQ